jgi:hypothetical protein
MAAAIWFRGRTISTKVLRYSVLKWLDYLSRMPCSMEKSYGEGRSQFNELLHRRGQPAFYAFDLLWPNGMDLRRLPLIRRKERLRKLVEKAKSPAIIYAQHIEKNGTALYREICQRDLEGIVSKKRDGVYSSTAGWLKIMNPGYTQHDGRQEMFTKFRERSARGHREG